jgi:hypothetical protein
MPEFGEGVLHEEFCDATFVLLHIWGGVHGVLLEDGNFVICSRAVVEVDLVVCMSASGRALVVCRVHVLYKVQGRFWSG